jgi:hypothetical protein
MAEQATPDLGQGQDALNAAILFGQEKVSPVAEAFFEHPLPTQAMEEGGPWLGQDEGIPGSGVIIPGCSDREAHGASSAA